MRNYILLFTLAAAQVAFAVDPVLWLKADAGVTRNGANGVTAWADSSGNGNHAALAQGETPPAYVEVQKQIRYNAPDPQANAAYGTSIAFTTSTMFVGAPRRQIFEVNGDGVVYTYNQTPQGWTPGPAILPDSIIGDHGFGSNIATDDTRLVVAADENIAKVYVYDLVDNTWSLSASLTTPELADYKELGRGLAVDGDTIYASAPSMRDGVVYVFKNGEAGWAWTETIEPLGLPTDANFGSSLLLHGDYMFVGANGYTGAYPGEGAVFVFQKSETGWNQVQVLPADSSFANLGGYLTAEGDTMVAGATFYNNQAGAAYVYNLTESGWSRTQVITTPQNVDYPRFGSGVSLNNGMLAVAVQSTEPAYYGFLGGVYTFVKSGNNWVQDRKMLPSNPHGERHGISGVTLREGMIYAQSQADISPLAGQGSVYQFDLAAATSAIRYSGAWSKMSGPLSLGTSVSLFAVASKSAGGAYRSIIHNTYNMTLGQFGGTISSAYGNGTSWGGTIPHYSTPLMTDSVKYLYGSTNNGTDDLVSLNGVLVKQRANPMAPFNDGYDVGRGPFNDMPGVWMGDIHEIIAFPEALTPEDQTGINAYLLAKYQIEVKNRNSTPYIEPAATGVYALGGTGAVLNITANTGAGGRQVVAEKIIGDAGGTFTGDSAESPDGTMVKPVVLDDLHYWRIEDQSDQGGLTYTITFDTKGMQQIASPGRLLLLKRNSSAEPWAPLNTSRIGDHLYATGLTSFSEFAVGSAIFPAVFAVDVINGNSVDVTFTKPVNASATIPGNYALSGPGKGTLTTAPIIVESISPETYRLHWSTGEMLAGGDISVTASSIYDTDNNLIDVPDSGTDAAAAIAVQPEVLELDPETRTALTIEFTEPMDESALQPENYSISGEGTGTAGVNPDTVTALGNARYRLQWNSGSMINGQNVTITVSPTLTDIAGNSMGTTQSASVVAVPVTLSNFSLQ